MISLKVLYFILKSTFMAFGGGNALFPFMRQETVVKNKWLTEKEFDKLIIATNMIPGPSVVESLSYISIKMLGKWKGAIITLVGILPHVLFALAILIFAQKYIPAKYLYVMNVSVMPVIIGLLLSFSIRFIKLSKKEVGIPLMVGLMIFSIVFSLFVPTPWNTPAIVMIFVIIITLVYGYLKERRGK